MKVLGTIRYGMFGCSPPFRRKAEGHCFRFYVVRDASVVVRGSRFLVCILFLQVLLQFLAWPILLKLDRCFYSGLKIRMCIFQNPEITFIRFSVF